jgi:hypothetical protein
MRNLTIGLEQSDGIDRDPLGRPSSVVWIAKAALAPP